MDASFKTKKEILKELKENLNDFDLYDITVINKESYYYDLEFVRQNAIKEFPDFEKQIKNLPLEIFDNFVEIYSCNLEHINSDEYSKAYTKSLKELLEEQGLKV